MFGNGCLFIYHLRERSSLTIGNVTCYFGRLLRNRSHGVICKSLLRNGAGEGKASYVIKSIFESICAFDVFKPPTKWLYIEIYKYVHFSAALLTAILFNLPQIDLFILILRMLISSFKILWFCYCV